jgi:HD-GYP domain-containing protein (c-di-GMP phosphodiesterase class II)
MTSDRPYRSGMPTEKAESILRSGAGKQWDPRMVEAFFQEIEEAHQICGVDRSRIAALLDGQPASASQGADEIAQAISSILT